MESLGSLRGGCPPDDSTAQPVQLGVDDGEDGCSGVDQTSGHKVDGVVGEVKGGEDATPLTIDLIIPGWGGREGKTRSKELT